MTHQALPIQADHIRRALSYVSPHMSRDEWARVGMAIKSELSDDEGFDLFDTWSQGAGEAYNAKATRDTWKSIKAGGGVGVGTLIHLAKAGGFEWPPKGDNATTPADPQELARHAKARAERAQAEEAQRQADQDRAAFEAVKVWAIVQDLEARKGATPCPYLTRKGIHHHGTRANATGALLVPMVDVSGKLWNLQTILPTKPAEGPDKLFIRGGRKSGTFHMLTAGQDATDPATEPTTTEAPPVVLVAEGYATAATLHEATGYPTAVAFDAGNMGKVAKAMRQKYPAALLVMCGDDDRTTEAKSGHRPNRN